MYVQTVQYAYMYLWAILEVALQLK